MFRGSVKSTGYSLHSPVSLSLPIPCVTVCQDISTGVHLNRRGASVQSTTGSRGVRISGSNAGYTVFRGSVKSIGYPLDSPVSPSLPLPCATVCHHISTGLYSNIRISLHVYIKAVLEYRLRLPVGQTYFSLPAVSKSAAESTGTCFPGGKAVGSCN